VIVAFLALGDQFPDHVSRGEIPIDEESRGDCTRQRSFSLMSST
jgi:hypothetical protein